MIKGWKNALLIVGIIIVFVLFNIYSIDTFLKGEKQSEKYNLYLFIISGISGILAVLVGFLIEVETVGLGLIIGGILMLMYGVIKFWSYASNVLRIVVLGIALIILIWLGFWLWDKNKPYAKHESSRKLFK